MITIVDNIDNKQIDTQRIKDYIQSYPDGVEVEDIIAHSGAEKDIIAHSGAEKLRVYPALFELEQEGWLAVTEREELGSPKRVRVKY